MKKITFFCFSLLIFYTKILAQNTSSLPKLPDTVFADYYSNRICTCVEPYFAGFSPKFIKLWQQIGRDFQKKKHADLTQFYTHLKTNEADASRYKNFSSTIQELCEEDFAELEDNYDFNWEEELAVYLGRNINTIMNTLHKNRKCLNTYTIWVFMQINVEKK